MVVVNQQSCRKLVIPLDLRDRTVIFIVFRSLLLLHMLSYNHHCLQLTPATFPPTDKFKFEVGVWFQNAIATPSPHVIDGSLYGPIQLYH